MVNDGRSSDWVFSIGRKVETWLVGVVVIGSVWIPMTQAQVKDDVQDQILTYLCPYDQGAGEQKVLECINGARKTILCICYGFTDPDICNALIAAHKRGVTVKVVMDHTEAAGPHQVVFVQQLKKAGIPVDIGTSESHSQLIHAKVCIIDDHVVVSGSWNFSHPTSSEQDNVIDVIDSPKRAERFTMFWNLIDDYVLQQTQRRTLKHHP